MEEDRADKVLDLHISDEVMEEVRFRCYLEGMEDSLALAAAIVVKGNKDHSAMKGCPRWSLRDTAALFVDGIKTRVLLSDNSHLSAKEKPSCRPSLPFLTLDSTMLMVDKESSPPS